jgi:hypothetical protein
MIFSLNSVDVRSAGLLLCIIQCSSVHSSFSNSLTFRRVAIRHFKILYSERPSFHWLELQQAYTTQRKEITEIIGRVFTLRPNVPVCMNELNEMHLA